MNKFTIHYKGGTKRRVNSAERDGLLLAREIIEIAPKEYRYTAPPRICHSFSDLPRLKLEQSLIDLRHYLEGVFLFLFGDQFDVEREETPEAFMLRLKAMGIDITPVARLGRDGELCESC